MKITNLFFCQLIFAILSLLAIIFLCWYMIDIKQLSWQLLVAQALITSTLIIRTWLFLQTDPNQKTIVDNQTFFNSNQVLNTLSDGIIMINHQGKINFLNQTAILITGYKLEDALDIHYSSVLRLFNQDNLPLIDSADPIVICQQTHTSSQLEVINLRTRSDKIIPITIQAVPVKDNSHQTLITFRNISHELEKEREQLEFISTASHEMRTPIATINGYLGLVLNPKISQIDTQARDYVIKAQTATTRLGELFKNLLSISKAEDKSITIDSTIFNLLDFVEKICDDFRPQLASRPLELVFAPTANRSKTLQPAVLVYTDKNLLHEAISGLIENAIKYTTQGNITVNVTVKDNDLAEISVADTGIGIPPEDIPHLFQKFYRVDNSQTREIGGTGLGLYLCRKLVENLHGRIWATSTLGQGSIFFIELNRINQAKATQISSRQRLLTTKAPE